MSEAFWDGALWLYHATIVNGAGGGGQHLYDFAPGAGNEMEVLYGEFLNGDTANRTLLLQLEDDSDNAVGFLFEGTLNAGVRMMFPGNDDYTASGMFGSTSSRYIVSGAMHFVAGLAGVAASENSEMALVCRIRGAVPTVTETGQSTPTITINTERVF